MINFKHFTPEALPGLIPYLRRLDGFCSDMTAGYLAMWSEGEDIRFCIENDTLILWWDENDQPCFSLPVGAESEKMTAELLDYARENDLSLRFYPVSKKQLNALENDERFQPLRSCCSRMWSDYIYCFEDVLTFGGRKFSRQRNHINQFKKLYGEPELRFIEKADEKDILHMLKRYEEEHPERSRFEDWELRKTKQILQDFDKYGMLAACLTVEGEIAAFSIGEVVGETLVIHVEKALREYEGSYPVMYQGFARLVCEHLGRPLAYINREDDSGDLGLRTSKLRYHPVFIEDKYIVFAGSPASKVSELPVIDGGKVFLTPFRKTDKREYFVLNTDVENNRFWGYDYREDICIPAEPDENVFYDALMEDMQLGDSINFAVRLSEGGKMIGEGILWHFTPDGKAELGCRISPEYHGRGYGSSVIRMLAEFAQETLGLRCWAKFYLENSASYRICEKAGMRFMKQDEEFFYFTY